MRVCVCVQLVEAMYVFLSDPRINAGTARREVTGLSEGWDGIKGTSVESGGQGGDLRSLPLNVDHRNGFQSVGALSMFVCA